MAVIRQGDLLKVAINEWTDVGVKESKAVSEITVFTRVAMAGCGMVQKNLGDAVDNAA